MENKEKDLETTEYKREILHKYKKLGIFFIILGVIFALEPLTPVRFLYKLWPLIITIIGCGFIGIFHKRERSEGLFLALGIFFILFSGFALYLNFNSWDRLSFLWPLFITFTGLCFILVFFMVQRNKLYLFVGLTLISISAVFFLVFSLNYNLWWTIFIFVGVSFFLVGENTRRYGD